jgi:hypothetical protein
MWNYSSCSLELPLEDMARLAKLSEASRAGSKNRISSQQTIQNKISIQISTRTSGLVFMFCVPGLVFGGTEGVRSRFHVLRSRTRFRRCRGRRVPFSCFAFPDSFSVVSKALGLVLMFFRARTRFRRYRGRQLQFSSFVRPDSFSAVLRASRPDFMFCASGLVFGGTEGVGSRFHVFRARTRFRRCRGRRVPFSCFALPD